MIGAAAYLRAAERLPQADLDTLLGSAPARTVVLAPHPDDESLGCGGLLAAAAAVGRDVRVVVVSDGSGSHPHSRAWPAPRLTTRRARETRAALGALGLRPDQVSFLGLPDRAVPDDGPALDRAVADLLALCGPPAGKDAAIGTVLAAWRHDPHRDHAATWAIATALVQRLPGRPRLLAYPVWGWAFAHPIAGFPMPLPPRLPGPPSGRRLDVRQRLPAKRRAILSHATQTGRVVRDDPGGFALPPRLLALAARPYEVFLEEPGLPRGAPSGEMR